VKTCNKCKNVPNLGCSFCKIAAKKAANSAAWAKANPQKDAANRLKWYKANKEKVAADGAAWRKANPDKNAAKAASRRARKFNATPAWLSDAQVTEIQDFYILAKELQWLSEEPLEVDHIIPLQGKSVCGLHVPWNLQILPQSINSSKGNRV
jgi:hypothetical protein